MIGVNATEGVMRYCVRVLALAACLLLVSAVRAQCLPGRPIVGQPVVGQPYTPTYPTYTPTYNTYYHDNYIPVAFPVPFTVAVPVVSYLYNGATYSPAFNAMPASYAPSLQVPAAGGQTSVSGQVTTGGAATPSLGSVLSGLTDSDIDKLLDRLDQRAKARAGKVESSAPADEDRPPAVRRQRKVNNLSRATQILSDNCSACHTGSKAKGGQTIFLSKGQLNPNADFERIVDAVDEGRMPPDARNDPNAALADDEVDELKRLIARR
jgi:hypothetical protein